MSICILRKISVLETKTQNCVESAITYSGANDEYSAWTRTDTESSFLVPVEETLLDPCFWQALGRKPRQNPIYKNGE